MLVSQVITMAIVSLLAGWISYRIELRLVEYDPRFSVALVMSSTSPDYRLII